MRGRAWLPNEQVEACFDEEDVELRKHRFNLKCTWDTQKGKALYIMLNPSIADFVICDPTVDQCIYFAKKEGYGSIEIVNLFSKITPSPEDLLKEKERNHEDNERYIVEAINSSEIIILAWGEQGIRFNACYKVFRIIESIHKKVYSLGVNRYGLPRHPGRLSRVKTSIQPFIID